MAPEIFLDTALSPQKFVCLRSLSPQNGVRNFSPLLPMTPQSLDDVAQSKGVLKALVTDLSGGLKEIIFPTSILPELCSTGVAYDGSSFQGINQINASDSILLGDPETLISVHESIADTEDPEFWIICSILNTDGKPHPNCARSKLLSLQKELASAWDGGAMMMGAEPEAFFVAKKEEVGFANGGNTNYFNPKDPKSFLIAEIARVLGAMEFEIERAHAEVGDEQFEINWRFDRAERTADRIQMYKLISHKVARNFDLDVTFLPKPYPTRNGSGMHCHLSVLNEKTNLFYSPDAEGHRYFSEKSRHFLAGILANSRALAAIANRTEASYARLVPGFEAPSVVAIGACNRSAACRIPAIADPALREKAIRAEFRYPDPLANPYLLGAGFVASGLEGIEKKTPFPGFCDQNLYALGLAELEKQKFDLLPRTLWESYKEFVAHKGLLLRLGKTMHTSYATLLLEEIDTCQSFANAESMRRHYFD